MRQGLSIHKDFKARIAAVTLLLFSLILLPSANAECSTGTISPFYGIWCSASKTEADAQEYAGWLSGKGFSAQVFVTTDWSNLNPEFWYVITAGVYESESAAYSVLPAVQSIVPDAYVKYSGTYKGTGHTDISTGASALNNARSDTSEKNSAAPAFPCQVMNCSEYVILRKMPFANSEEIARIPLGTMLEAYRIPPYRIDWNDWFQGQYTVSDHFAWCCYEGYYGFVDADCLYNITTQQMLNDSPGLPDTIDGIYQARYSIGDTGVYEGGENLYLVKSIDSNSASITFYSFASGAIEEHVVTKDNFGSMEGVYAYVSNTTGEGAKSYFDITNGCLAVLHNEEGWAYCYRIDMTEEEFYSGNN